MPAKSNVAIFGGLVTVLAVSGGAFATQGQAQFKVGWSALGVKVVSVGIAEGVHEKSVKRVRDRLGAVVKRYNLPIAEVWANFSKHPFRRLAWVDSDAYEVKLTQRG